MALLLVLALAACLTPQQDGANRVNDFRRSRGVAPLAVNQTLVNKAQGWAQTMARQGTISHSNLSQGVPPGWRTLGENVGVGRDLAHVDQLLRNSPPHVRNTLNVRFTQVGVGVATGRDGRTYVAQVFMG